MREILFRGKCVETGEWVEGFLFSYGEGTEYAETYILGELDYRESIYDVWKCADKVHPNTVGQFTGMRDKIGNKIFEGDIVYAKMDYGPAGWHDATVDIGFKRVGGYRWEYFDLSTIVVIGNVYDNPELLKGEN